MHAIHVAFEFVIKKGGGRGTFFLLVNIGSAVLLAAIAIQYMALPRH